jgi:hypothetical protein
MVRYRDHDIARNRRGFWIPPPLAEILVSLVFAAIVVTVIVVFSGVVPSADAYLPPHNPPWPPTYNVTESLITMQCNSSGYSNAHRASMFGIVSYDWSNAKAQWAKQQPMDCEERLSVQASMLDRVRRDQNGNNASANTNTHTFVYRNIVKALPWFSTVRAKLVDPSYDGFFLRFATENKTEQEVHVPRCAVENASKCSNLYHDQEQTPQVPTPQQPHPDGACDPSHGCDCGFGLPCGEFYFDHRNGTMLREWLVEEVVLGALITRGDNDNDNDDHNNNRYIVDGVFLDDYWCSDLLCAQTNQTLSGCPCNDPFQGPTEAHAFAVSDMGLSDQDVWDIAVEWNSTMALVEERLLQHNAYTWWLMDGQENANAQPVLFELDGDSNSNDEDDNDNEKPNDDEQHIQTRASRRSKRCIDILEDACRQDSTWQTRPKLFGFSVNETTHRLLRFDLEWAFFLLVRGPFAWAGWGVWGMTWPFQKEPRHGASPPLPHGVPLPDELKPEGQTDYGVPLEVCHSKTPGVFRRDWSNGWVVEINCLPAENEENRGDGWEYCGNKEPCESSFGVSHRIVRVESLESADTIADTAKNDRPLVVS